MTAEPRRYIITRGFSTNTRVDVVDEDALADQVYMQVWDREWAYTLAEAAWKHGKTGELHPQISVSRVIE